MGCSSSSEVAEKAVKPLNKAQRDSLATQNNATSSVIKQIPQIAKSFIIGTLSSGQQMFGHVNLDSLQIRKMSTPQGFICRNFSSILEFQKGKYFITGGISHNLKKISQNAYIYNSFNHSMQQVQSMSQARYTHVSLLYGNCIYVIGGRHFGDDSKAILRKCQKYSIAQQKWLPVSDMNVARCTCFGLVWNSAIYVFGGYTGPFERSTKIEYLNKQSEKWKILDIELYRGIQGSVILPSSQNEFTIFGGLTNSGPTSSVTSINLKNKTIQSKLKLKKPRSLFKSFFKNEQIYLIGGDDQFTSEIYNIAQQSSTIHTSQFGVSIDQFDNFGFSASTIVVPFNQNEVASSQKKAPQAYEDEIVYIFGTTEDPFVLELNISIPKVRFYSVPIDLKLYSHQGGEQLSRTTFLLFGGIQEDTLSVVSSDTFLYDISTQVVRKMAKMNQNRYAFTQLSIKKNNQVEYIYAFGGATTNIQGKLVYLSVCQKYIVKQNKWQVLPPLPQKLISPMSGSFKDKVIVFGGKTQNNIRSLNIHVLDTQNLKWKTIDSKLQFGLQAGSVIKVSPQEFYIFGGRVESGDSKGIWSLYINQKKEKNKQEQYLCVFQEKGQMSQAKSLHKIYKPKHQEFYVIFGGQKSSLSCYRSDNLKEQNSDMLASMKSLFQESLQNLNQKNLKKYLIVSR